MERLASRDVVRAHLEAEGALPRRGHHIEGVEDAALGTQAQPLEARDREQRGVETLVRFDLADPRWHVAAQGNDCDVRAQKPELRDAPQARGPDARTRLEIAQ